MKKRVAVVALMSFALGGFFGAALIPTAQAKSVRQMEQCAVWERMAVAQEAQAKQLTRITSQLSSGQDTLNRTLDRQADALQRIAKEIADKMQNQIRATENQSRELDDISGELRNIAGKIR